MPDSYYQAKGIEVVDVDRGGKVTYHGPGQLVGYTICRIDDVVAFVRTIEQVVIAALADMGVRAGTREGLTGVWTQDRKIGSLGLHVSRGVTTHGFSVNVEMDLEPFHTVTPCGLPGTEVTSLGLETGNTGLMTLFQQYVSDRFAKALGATAEAVASEQIWQLAEQR